MGASGGGARGAGEDRGGEGKARGGGGDGGGEDAGEYAGDGGEGRALKGEEGPGGWSVAPVVEVVSLGVVGTRLWTAQVKQRLDYTHARLCGLHAAHV